MGNPIFWRHHQELRNCLPLAFHLQGGGILYNTKKAKEDGGHKGQCSLGPDAAGVPCAAVGGALPYTAAAASSPRHGRRLSHLGRHISIIICITSSSFLL
jgi:hypothetical protein